MFYIDVILPLAIKQTFTYSVNKDEAAFLKQGFRVSVPFGKSKLYTAIVYQVHNTPPQGYEVKSIDQILDETPIVTPKQIKHWEWIASYYMCTLGEVIKAGLPSAFLLESETMIALNSKSTIDEKALTDEQFLVFEALQHRSPIHINDVRSILDRSNVVKVLHHLLEQKVIQVYEEAYEQYTPKLKRYVKLSSHYEGEHELKILLDEMTRAHKQREVLMHLFTLQAQSKKEIAVDDLKKKSGVSSAVIKTLIDKEILIEYHLKIDRVSYQGAEGESIKDLNKEQQVAYNEIRTSFETQEVTLLHGVTSSGKTEIYVRLIEEQLNNGKQTLYILPEIAVTTQLISRLQQYFGENISVYHSKYSLNERVEVWNNVLNNKIKTQIIVGVRSSVFLPFQNLGLVVIDEEHEPSFKQYNPSPRYNGRDAAIVLAKLHGAKTLLGSATPSLETYHNAKQGKYGLVSLTRRYGNVLMPTIELVDIKEKHYKRLMKGHFSDRLLEEIHFSLKNNEQVLLFQNKRGYSPVVECTTCGTAPECPNCDVTLVYHRHKNQLRCHYCGYHIAMMVQCIACGSESLDTKGFGTEQIETELHSLFPEHQVARMDQDTTRGKYAHAKIINKLENGEIDILVGTQMLAKGLDFRNVSLVGVMNADSLLNFPDFRAHERSFHLLQQVSGRAGRTKKQGKVIIQTYNPHHVILQQVSTNNYPEMYKVQSDERYQYKYPPYFKIIKITFKDRNFKKVENGSLWYALALQQKMNENVLGPEAPPISRIKNKYISNVLVKIPQEQSLKKTKEYILGIQRNFNLLREFSSVQVTLDVDNY
ncbi:primosomal protein N' [Patiriisocius sp. Uisw_017]|uniref:replication restart helicase PriA n=1 Tax=Patiriisocius sp. Uisw_017 TaxID=3230968 RepID=UPI0039E75C93